MKNSLHFVVGCLICISTDAADPIAIAHRGLLRHAPENTLPAFAACMELRMGIELDIRTTSDGHLVVLHDDNLKRTTNGPNKSIREVTLAEVKKLDAGSWFDASYKGVKVPTLEETFQLIQQRKQGPTIIALNIKQITRDGEKKLVAMMRQYNMLDNAFAFDQSREMSERFKKIDPRVRVGQNVNRESAKAALKENRLDVFLLSYTPSQEEVEQFHQSRKQVLYNYSGTGENRRNPINWRQAQAAGVDGILTDYPTRCQQTWRENQHSSQGPNGQ
jgi:glycerophosphoryl diester phosphodiesterase